MQIGSDRDRVMYPDPTSFKLKKKKRDPDPREDVESSSIIR